MQSQLMYPQSVHKSASPVLYQVTWSMLPETLVFLVVKEYCVTVLREELNIDPWSQATAIVQVSKALGKIGIDYS